jgi:lipopolysaccharide/colanic/teichoic acid biosynthesis glycosyltransferase
MPDSAPAMKKVDHAKSATSAKSHADTCLLTEQHFQRAIVLERKRSERSGKAFLLMLVDSGNCRSSEERRNLIAEILSSLSLSTRETDVLGWYKKNVTAGVIFTEISSEDKASISAVMRARITEVLRNRLKTEQLGQITISFHVFPDEWGVHEDQNRSSNTRLYPDLLEREDSQRLPRIIKRIIDVLGSMLALLLLSPVFLLVAVAIKLTSRGPVLFRQPRVGQYGALFTLLKFRSMCVNNDDGNHRQYVAQLIAGRAEKQTCKGDDETREGVYKLTSDSRITAVGAFLRRLSLDELPQFLNVLNGEMSLVGPRPSLSYEVAAYDLWHRRRLLEAKPGITGLWQVNGRNRIKFDEMVRLDLAYARTWSPWLDIKILLRTPRAVLEGAH